MIRLKTLDLIRWGRIEGEALNFEPPEALHVVYGDNEAGKSTTRRAIAALLFGVPARTQDAHRFEYNELRIGSSISTSNGDLDVIRRKANIKTLLDGDGNDLDEAVIERELHGLTDEVYAGLFELTHERLLQGGKDLLDGNGEIGEALFSASSGTEGLRTILESLDIEASEIFKPTGRKTPLNVAIREIGETAKEVKDATTRPNQAKELIRDRTKRAERLGEIDTQLQDIDKRIAGANRLQSSLPILRALEAEQEELAGLAGTPTLPENFVERRVRAEADLDSSTAQINTLTASIATMREQMGDKELAEKFLGAGPQISELPEALSNNKKAALDRKNREGEHKALSGEIRERVRRIGFGLTEEALAQIDTENDSWRRMKDQLSSFGEVSERLRAAASAVETARTSRDRSARSVDELEEPPALDDIEVAIKAAIRDTHLPGEIEALSLELRKLRNSSKDLFAELGFDVSGDVNLVARAVLPDASVVEKFKEQLSELLTAKSTLESEIERLEKESHDLTSQRREIRQGGNELSISELEGSRARRDKSWAALLEAQEEGKGFTSIAADYVSIQGDTDRIADDLLAHSDQVAQLAENDRLQAQVHDELSDSQKAIEATIEAIDRLRSDWESEWTSVSCKHPEIEFADAWSETYGRGREQWAEARVKSDAVDAAHERVLSHVEVLRAGSGVEPSDADVRNFVQVIESREIQLESTRDQRQAVKEAKDAAKRDADRFEDAELELRQAQAGMDAWTAAWDIARAQAGLPEAMPPEEALGHTDLIVGAIADLQSLKTLNGRIEGIDRDRREFAENVKKLCKKTRPELASNEDFAAAQALVSELEEIKRLDGKVSEAEQQLSGSEAQRNSAEELLGELLKAAGCESAEELPDIESKAARLRQLSASVNEKEADVIRIANLSLEHLRETVGEKTIADIDADLEAAEREKQDALSERDAAHRELLEATAALEVAQESESASDAAELNQQKIAHATELAERYSAAKLSASILRSTIEKFRAEHQGPLMERANELFPMLTGGEYKGVAVDWAGDEQVIVAIDSHDEKLGVDELSDGTREQLFLALRIAAIERWVDSSTAVPVLFDDVFLESDDARSARIFKVLRELAKKTQVIVFTHHAHLLEIARETLPKSQLTIQRM